MIQIELWLYFKTKGILRTSTNSTIIFDIPVCLANLGAQMMDCTTTAPPPALMARRQERGAAKRSRKKNRMDHGAALFPGSITSSYAARRSHLLLYSFHFVSEESECVVVEFAFPNRNKRSDKNRCTFSSFSRFILVLFPVLFFLIFSYFLFPLQPLLSVLVYLSLSLFPPFPLFSIAWAVTESDSFV